MFYLGFAMLVQAGLELMIFLPQLSIRFHVCATMPSLKCNFLYLYSVFYSRQACCVIQEQEKR